MKVDIAKLTNALKEISFIEFAYLFGSSKNGEVKKSSDVDIAVYFFDNQSIDFDKLAQVFSVIEKVVPSVDIDLCRLNSASETLRFEVLKGNCLFVREKSMDKFTEFYSRTCNEYEDYSFWAKKQLEYRGISS